MLTVIQYSFNYCLILCGYEVIIKLTTFSTLRDWVVNVILGVLPSQWNVKTTWRHEKQPKKGCASVQKPPTTSDSDIKVSLIFISAAGKTSKNSLMCLSLWRKYPSRKQYTGHVSILLFHLHSPCPGCRCYQIITLLLSILSFFCSASPNTVSLRVVRPAATAGGWLIDPFRPLHMTFNPHHHCDSEDAFLAPVSGTF